LLQKWVREGSPKRQRQQRAVEELSRVQQKDQQEQGSAAGAAVEGWSDRYGASIPSVRRDGNGGGWEEPRGAAAGGGMFQRGHVFNNGRWRGGVDGGVGVVARDLMETAVAADAMHTAAVAEAREDAAVVSTSGMGSPSRALRAERFRMAVSGSGYALTSAVIGMLQ
jgi:hypothetical protein